MVPHLLKKVPPHTTYVEAFGGGASLLFAKEPAEVDVYNDLDSLLVNFFRVLRRKPDEFQRMIELVPYSREEYMESKKLLKSKSLETGGNIGQAVDFYIMARQSVSGLVGAGWRYGITKNVANVWCNSIERLPFFIERLRRVQIESLNAIMCIRKYDTPKTFFYLDPPYHHSARSDIRYRVDYTDEQHRYLLEEIQKVKGMVLLSGYHCPLYDNRLKDWHHWDIEMTNQATPTTRGTKLLGKGALANTKAIEVLWWNAALNKRCSQLTLDLGKE